MMTLSAKLLTMKKKHKRLSLKQQRRKIQRKKKRMRRNQRKRVKRSDQLQEPEGVQKVVIKQAKGTKKMTWMVRALNQSKMKRMKEVTKAGLK